ncbi:MAG: OmpA family protein [Sphingobacteriales bacterium]|nr:MAG: OmpA family protein [Sphingobacteriales bacterium]
MKKIVLSLLAAMGCLYSFAQTADLKKNSALGVHFTLTDFQTAADIRKSGLSSVLQKGNYTDISLMNPGLGLSYWKGLTNQIDFSSWVNFSFLKYPVPNKPVQTADAFTISADANLNFKMLPDNFVVVPYLSAGIGATKYKGYFSAYMPLGAGLQVNLFNDAFLMINSQYRVPTTSLGAYHFFHSIGFVGVIGKKKEPVVVVPPPPPPPPPPVDTDKDGVVDSLDACPTVPGPASLNGCPDTDGDGILDKDDACPTKPGIAKYKGCPIPDTDGDGINDEEDKCPTVPGLARYQGCPIPDTDGDGINDEEDKCPTVPGVAENFGCPKIDEAIIKKIEYAAKNVYFATGKYTLLAKSFKPLNDVVKILAEHPELKLDIGGHTDNTGDATKNQALSQNRAKAVLDYLVKKGVAAARVTSAGYGQDQPVADNKTAAGRAKNRRVEIKVRNY